MEENKYYTPCIEDLFVGYEGEWLQDNGDWEISILQHYNIGSAVSRVALNPNKEIIRTRYLTKEQVEEEWNFKGGNSLFNEFRKEGYVLFLYENIHQITILKNRNGEDICIYGGNCPSINEFRYVCKLLNI